MVVRGHPSLSLTRQCRLLSIGRSSLYDRPKGESAETLALMRRIDALFLKYPFYGARQMVRHLRREGVRIGRRRAARLMRLLGLQAVYRAPRTSAPHLGHRVYPYLLRGLAIERPNHVWCADITYIPVRRGFLYLVAIMDWASRCVLAWRLSNTLDAGFCVEALDEALARHGTPQIFNTDQGSQFTGFAFTARLREAGIRISMDGRGRCMDNIFIERLWRSLKYEAVYLHEIADGFAARRVIGQWIGFYNTERPHSALGGRTPAEAYRGDTPVDMMDKPLRALTTYPQAQQQQQKDRSKRILAAQTSTGIHLENAVSLSDKPTPPQTDYIVRIPFERNMRHRPFHPLIERIVQEQVGQYWRNYPALWRAPVPCDNGAVLLDHGSLQPALDIEQHPPAVRMVTNGLQQQLVVDVVEEPLDVHVQHPVVAPASPTRCPDGVNGGSLRPISV